jgi:hypothetical protein
MKAKNKSLIDEDGKPTAYYKLIRKDSQKFFEKLVKRVGNAGFNTRELAYIVSSELSIAVAFYNINKQFKVNANKKKT